MKSNSHDSIMDMLRLSKLFLWFGFNLAVILYLASAFRVRIPILCFHQITSKPPQNPLTWSQQRFEALIKRLIDEDYQFILPGESVPLRQYLTKKQIILTFDDGTIDHYETVLPMLSKYKIKALFFWISSQIKKLNPMQRYLLVQRMGQSRFGSHTTQWRSMLSMSSAERQAEIDQSVEFLEGFSKQKMENFAFPSGEYDQALAEMTLKRFKYVFSVDMEYFWPETHMVQGRYMLNFDTADSELHEYLSRAKPFLKWDFWVLSVSLILLNLLMIFRRRSYS